MSNTVTREPEVDPTHLKTDFAGEILTILFNVLTMLGLREYLSPSKVVMSFDNAAVTCPTSTPLEGDGEVVGLGVGLGAYPPPDPPLLGIAVQCA
jgi:hypothetical protein